MHYAAEIMHPDVIYLLLEKNAEPTLSNVFSFFSPFRSFSLKASLVTRKNASRLVQRRGLEENFYGNEYVPFVEKIGQLLINNNR